METNQPGSQQGGRDDSGPYLGFAAGLHVVAHEVTEVPHGGEHAARDEETGQGGPRPSNEKG